MKKIIRYLADISGVTLDIQNDSAKQIGNRMQSYSYWFTGGVMHGKQIKSIINILHLYPEKCLKHGHFGLFANQFMDLRSELYEMDKNNESIFDKK